ncbi:MAG: DUF1926 domain-containing protein [Deltaproteobacteria bacterium]|nr:DUF1926 domain-containing protein [Deltaproteobacteria bacterium]
MGKIQLVTAVHGHQPVGNLDSVMERACDQCYSPFLQTLQRHPSIRIGLHLSGCLLEWMERRRARLLDMLAELVGNGQVELLGGGFYEPILTVLSEVDAYGQIDQMQRTIKERFGVEPKGAWIAERVWQPDLLPLLSRSGLTYTLVDDSTLFAAGLAPQRLSGYWVTERAAETLALFPIDQQLRFAIPFRPVPEMLAQLADLRQDRDRVLCYGDDLEKFGLWPETRDWVYDASWLEDFFRQAEESDWLELVTPTSVLLQQPPTGKVYPPSSAYEELERWSLPTESLKRLDALRAALAQAGLSDAARPFLRAGCWQSFMAKYPEADRMHKKMMLVSRKLSEGLADEEPWLEEHEQARKALYRGQCNCAYWHGLFGGIYLPHLRDAVYRELLTAESILDRRVQGDDDWIAFDQYDYDADLADEILIENAALNVYIDPAEGGTVVEIDYRPAAFQLANTLSRHPEAYHREILAGEEADGEAHAPPPCDALTRACFMDRFPAPATRLEDLQNTTYAEEGDFLAVPYAVEQIGIDEEGDCDFNLLLYRSGNIRRDGLRHPLVVEKRFRIPADAAELRVDYTLKNPSEQPLDLVFCPELNLNLLAGNDGRRLFDFEGLMGPGPRMGTMGEVEDAGWIALVDHLQSLRIELQVEPATTIWRHPVETLTRSESGVQTIYQGSALGPRWELTLPPRSERKLGIRLRTVQLDPDAVVPIIEE